MKILRFFASILIATSLVRCLELPSTPLDSQGRRWTYYTAVPPVRVTAPAIVLVFHGAGGSGGGFLDRSGWAEKARTEGFVAVAPSGLCLKPDESPDFLTNPRLWNVGSGLFQGERMQIDDGRFVMDLLHNVLEEHQGDPHKVYLVGHSNGATFCYRLAAQFPRRWAAVAGVAGTPYPSLGRLAHPVPTYAIFGTEDRLIPLQGGKVDTPWGARDVRPVREQLGTWATALGLDGQWESVSDDEFQTTVRCGVNFQVTYLKGHGHNYPSPTQPLAHPIFGPVKTDVLVNDLIWDFFKTRTQQ